MATATLTAKELISYTDPAGNLIATVSRSVTGDSAITAKDQFAAASSNVLLAFAFAKARTQYFAFYSDQPVTIKTNSSGSPQETITLAAGSTYAWNTSHPEANPLVGDVTALYVSVPGATAANVSVFVLTNATP